MNGSHPPQTSVHSPSKARTRTRVATHTENRAVDYQSFSAFTASGAPASFAHRGPDARFVDYHGTGIHSEATRAPHRHPAYARKGEQHASSRYKQPEGAIGLDRNAENVTLLQRPFDPRETSLLRRRSEAAIRQASLQDSAKANSSQANISNIPPGSRVDEWRKDVARANPYNRYYDPTSPAQRFNRALTHSSSQLSKPLEPAPSAEPKRYHEYVYGPNDGVSQPDSESEYQAQMQGGSQRPRAGNGTPYPWDYKHQTSYRDPQAQAGWKASGGGETDPSEY